MDFNVLANICLPPISSCIQMPAFPAVHLSVHCICTTNCRLVLLFVCMFIHTSMHIFLAVYLAVYLAVSFRLAICLHLSGKHLFTQPTWKKAHLHKTQKIRQVVRGCYYCVATTYYFTLVHTYEYNCKCIAIVHVIHKNNTFVRVNYSRLLTSSFEVYVHSNQMCTIPLYINK